MVPSTEGRVGINYAQCWCKFLLFFFFCRLPSNAEYLIKQAVKNLKTQNHSLEWKQLGH